MGMPFVLEIRGPDGYLLTRESLYDHLRRTYVREWMPDEFRFDELEFFVDGSPVLPRAQGRA
jgi:hypothetical protein